MFEYCEGVTLFSVKAAEVSVQAESSDSVYREVILNSLNKQ